MQSKNVAVHLFIYLFVWKREKGGRGGVQLYEICLPVMFDSLLIFFMFRGNHNFAEMSSITPAQSYS